MSQVLGPIAAIFVFPGLLFLVTFAFAAEFLDRKFCARLQNRVGPPWFQGFADFIKLIGKEEVIPTEADVRMFKLAPLLAFVSAGCAYFYIPTFAPKAAGAFGMDVVVTLYLLTIPTFTFFLGGLYSRSVYSMIGAVRTLTQLFAYEVPLFMSILASALLADSWSLTEIAAFYRAHPLYAAANVVGFAVAVIALMGKLEKTPFDSPEAETEIVAGGFTEYGGKHLAIFKLAINIEMIVGSSLLLAVFAPFTWDVNPLVGGLIYLVKVVLMIGLITLLRSIFARLRIDQMIDFCWKILAPLALGQVVVNLFIKQLIHS